jgi:molybdate transport system substrate-binding protein
MTPHLLFRSLGHRSLVLSALALAASLGGGTVRAADMPVIAVAANMTEAVQSIAEQFERAGGQKPRLSFGASGNFVRQIQQGAPFELFLSADESSVATLARDGRTLDDGALYAIGRIVLFVPTGSTLKADASLDDLGAALKDGRLKRFSIANPDVAPYGKAAREVLQAKGLWSAIEGRLALGENVGQAAQFAASGSTEGGIMPLSLAKTPALSSRGTFVVLPDSAHAPLRQRMVLLKNAGETARAFYAFLQGPKARATLEQSGYTLPPPPQ